MKAEGVAMMVLLFLLLASPAVLFAQSVQNDLDQKLMMGYQGWFLCHGDGSPANDWRHWFRNSNDPSADQLNIDNWPDMSEYPQTYATDLTYADGSAAELFSAFDETTTMIHFQWMRDHQIYGIYLQRFLGEAVNDQRFFKIRNHVLQNVMNAAQTYDRHFALMYDVTGVPENGFYDKLINDWEYLVDTYQITDRPEYVRQNDMPVLAIWGMGFTHNDVTATTAQAVLDYFHHSAQPKYRAYVVGGVPGQWRTLDGDSKNDPLWASVYRSLDMLSPWTVGRYHKSTVDDWKAQRIVPDLAECTKNEIDYMPVIFPGGSWFNQTGRTDSSRINDNPRDGGNFYWRQAFNTISAGARFLYVAMFDEVDEGTAMFKLAPNDSFAPDQGTFVTLDEDGYDLPSDWYLQLAGASQKMFDKTIPLTSDMPITPRKIQVSRVIISPTTVDLVIGGSRQLTATVEPAKAFNKTIHWSSSNPSVASVNAKGKVSAIALGSVTITATAEDGGLHVDCAVTVTTGVPVANVTISPLSAVMDVGATLQLTAVISPADASNRTVTWRSTDEAVATINSSGLVTAVAEGKATIRVKTEDGGKTAGARITVSDPSQMPFTGVPHAIPGLIEAEDYDLGGEGLAYHDLDSSNQGGQYRSDGVDIENCSQGGYNVGWLNAGEWLEYTVNVAFAAAYNLDVLVATQLNGAKFHIEFNGVNRTSVLAVPNTGGWQTWEQLSKPSIALSAGVQTMRIFRETDGADFNLDSFTFSAMTGVSTSLSSTSASLLPAYPNPFNQSTTVRYTIVQPTPVQITVYNIRGEEVRTLVDAPHLPGQYECRWDGVNDLGLSGLYILRFETSEHHETRKIILLK